MRMTERRAEIIQYLQRHPASLLMVRPVSAVPMYRRQELLTGTRVVHLVDGQPVEFPGVPALNGAAASGLADGGYLALSPAPLQWGRLYVLSERGKALNLDDMASDGHPKNWDAEMGPRIFRQNLDEIAAEFGASLEFNNTRKWWEISIAKGGSRVKERIPLTDPDGKPIARLNDFSMTEWREVITRNALTNNLPVQS